METSNTLEEVALFTITPCITFSDSSVSYRAKWPSKHAYISSMGLMMKVKRDQGCLTHYRGRHYSESPPDSNISQQ